VKAVTPSAVRMSRLLKKQGFSLVFVGGIVVYGDGGCSACSLII